MKQSLDVLYIQLTDDADDFSLSLLTFCLLNLSISDRGVLKSPTIIINLYISAFGFSSFCLTCFNTLDGELPICISVAGTE